jgi:hypothetical protein
MDMKGARAMLPRCISMSRAARVKYLNQYQNRGDEPESKRGVWFISTTAVGNAVQMTRCFAPASARRVLGMRSPSSKKLRVCAVTSATERRGVGRVLPIG